MNYMELLTGAPAEAEVTPEAKPTPKPSYYNDLVGAEDNPKAAPTPKVIQDPKMGADIGAAFTAGLGDDPKVLIRYFSQQRGIPEDRYGIVDNQIVYRGDDGNIYAEVPSDYSPTSLARRGAASIAKSPALVGGAIAGIKSAPLMASGPAGLAGSMAITAGGAMAGEGVRQGLASHYLGQDVNLGTVAQEGAQAALGQGIGAGMTSWAERGVARDISQLNQPAAQALRRKASAEGIELTPAEETNLATLKSQQKYVGNSVGGQNTMQEFYDRREGQIGGAVQRFLNGISGVDSAEEAGAMAVKAAGNAVDKLTAERAAQASPLYKKAFEAQAKIDTTDVIAAADVAMRKFDKEGSVGRVISNVRKQLFNFADDGTRSNTPKADLEQLHGVKMEIDNLLAGGSETPLGNVAKRQLTDIKNELLRVMDEASPDYAAARKVYADASPGIERVREGFVGKLDEMGQLAAQNAAKVLLGKGSGPGAIREARAQLEKASPEAWQALKRAYLQDVFETAQNETVQGTSNVAGNFRKALMGNTQQKSRLRAALTAEEFSNFEDLTVVLGAASRVKRIGSDTEFNRLITEAEKSAARPAYAKLLRNMNPAQALRSFDDWATGRNMEANAAKIAEVITQPGASEKIKQLRQLSPRSIQARVLIGHLLTEAGSVGVDKADAALFPTPDSPPQVPIR